MVQLQNRCLELVRNPTHAQRNQSPCLDTAHFFPILIFRTDNDMAFIDFNIDEFDNVQTT